ncbi:hypothetical protein [Nannocystis punicea]|uniref:Uncharacterized protein n=1 Tax=Nannocystis punicea TaxID=2995304 RepID=A0ABY7HDB4_9BACT|nr:hypothetical protein [Nannocystis poenicansa]WAS97257.1 hypothetical protein O0S08_14005 [Nannocystis poenicansa]
MSREPWLAALALLLLAACPSPAGERQTTPGAPAPASPQSQAPPATPPPQVKADPSESSQRPEAPTQPDSQDTAPDLEHFVFPAKSACPGGLDIPEFDPAKAPWWDKLTGAQRIAFLRSGAHKHWSAVTDSPIVLHRVETGLVLRSVDGCWRQELSTERLGELRIDGPSGLAWHWDPKGLLLVDLWNPGAPVPVLTDRVAARDLAIVDSDGSVLMQLKDHLGEPPGPAAPRARLRWSTTPGFEPAKSDDVALALAPAGERWLVENLSRQAPGPRTARFSVHPAHELAAESRCKDPSVCGGAAPFGASNLEYISYSDADEEAPRCALFDPTAGVWYRDETRAVQATDPRQFEGGGVGCETRWEFDITGRAYVDGARVCVSTQCVRPEGEALGFVRGSVFIFATF